MLLWTLIALQMSAPVSAQPRGTEYSAPPTGQARAELRGEALLFDMGDEQERRHGALLRVQISVNRRRITEMLVTRRTASCRRRCPAVAKRRSPAPR
jgi:hypothetical protein